jgi:DNA modification methylase
MKVIKQEQGENWTAFHGDTVEVARGLPDHSVDFSVFSPPFVSLFSFSDDSRDMSNCRRSTDFFEHFKYLIAEQKRVMRPGRNVAIHCVMLTTTQQTHGRIGLYDFRGDIVRAYEDAGFTFHSEVTIWKDPVCAMQRTKALGLLWKQIKKDSTRSRMGTADYIVTMQAPGKNETPVAHTAEEFPVELWQKYASPVWDDINPSDTLQKESARDNDDERHICPLQLEVIRRCNFLWSNPGDVVWSPFMGIGSEGYVSLQMGRKFIGAELKESYFRQAVKNLATATRNQQVALPLGATNE